MRGSPSGSSSGGLTLTRFHESAQKRAFDSWEDTELPKVVAKRRRTLTPAEYRRLMDAIPDQQRMMIQTAIETGLRGGELIALRTRHLDPEHGRLTVEETIIEVLLRAAPNGSG